MREKSSNHEFESDHLHIVLQRDKHYYSIISLEEIGLLHLPLVVMSFFNGPPICSSEKQSVFKGFRQIITMRFDANDAVRVEFHKAKKLFLHIVSE